MKIKVVANDEFSRVAADYAIAQILEKPDSRIGLAGGNTTKPIHAQLVEALADRHGFLDDVVFFNLDEYYGAPKTSLGTCYGRMIAQLLKPLGVKAENIRLFNPEASDPDGECRRVLSEIEKAGGIDLQYFGIGANGHVGFCNPGTPFASTAFSFPFAEEFRREKAQNFGSIEATPTTGMTLGISDCMQVKRALLVANGKAKSAIIKRIVNGPINEETPASVFRLHPQAVLLLDDDAASEL